jgi:hypothetical protein
MFKVRLKHLFPILLQISCLKYDENGVITGVRIVTQTTDAKNRNNGLRANGEKNSNPNPSAFNPSSALLLNRTKITTESNSDRGRKKASKTSKEDVDVFEWTSNMLRSGPVVNGNSVLTGLSKANKKNKQGSMCLDINESIMQHENMLFRDNAFVASCNKQNYRNSGCIIKV